MTSIPKLLPRQKAVWLSVAICYLVAAGAWLADFCSGGGPSERLPVGTVQFLKVIAVVVWFVGGLPFLLKPNPDSDALPQPRTKVLPIILWMLIPLAYAGAVGLAVMLGDVSNSNRLLER